MNPQNEPACILEDLLSIPGSSRSEQTEGEPLTRQSTCPAKKAAQAGYFYVGNITVNSITKKAAFVAAKCVKIGSDKSYRYPSAQGPIYKWRLSGDFRSDLYHQGTKSVISSRSSPIQFHLILHS